MGKVFKQLAKLTLITSFGRNSNRPLKKAGLRLLAAALALPFFGLKIAKPVRSMGLAQNLPADIVLIVTAVFIFAILGFLLLPMADFTENRQAFLSKNLTVLPLRKLTNWFVAILPFLIVAILISEFFWPILGAFAYDLKTSLLIIVAGYILGLFAVAGLAIADIRGSMILKYLVFITFSASQLFALDQIFTSESNLLRYILVAGIILSLIACSFGFLQKYYHSNIQNQSNKTILSKAHWPSWIITNGWFGLKLIRNKKSFGSFLFCVIIGLVFAVVSILRKQNYLSSDVIWSFAAILACAFACEARGISRRFKTPEILGLKGTNYFANSQLKGVILLNLIVILPFIFCIADLHGHKSIMDFIYGLTTIFAASCLGLLFSTIFVPAGGEFGAQFFTTVLAIASLLILPKWLKFSTVNLELQSIAWLCVCGVCFLLILLIEDKRRNNYGYA